MTRKLKRITLILLSTLCAFLLVFAGACAGKKMSVYNAAGTLVFNNKTTSIQIEYAETYALPFNVQVGGKKVKLESMKLFKADGTECKLSYGSYQFMQVGDYTVCYVAGGVEKSFTIRCVDSSYPEINMHAATLFGIVGERVTLPNFTSEDSAGIDRESEKLTVIDPDGIAAAVDENRSFAIEKAGEYKVVYSIADVNGNVSEKTLSVTGFAKYEDETRQDSVIYNFNNEEYLNLTMDVPEYVDAKHEIVETGYPAIENEADGNKVLKITSEATFDDVYTRFVLHEDLLASTGHRIVVRLAVSTDTDYIKLFRNQSSLSDSGLVAQKFGLKANTWYNFEINPLSFGYNMAFKDFVLMFRDKGETALYIDEIYFTPIEFEDTSLDDGVIADFDETGYLANVYQNEFGDPTTTRNERVGGSVFSIVSGADLPAANDANTRTPGLAPSGSALKVETKFNRGGVTFMFPTPIDLNEIISLNLRIYVEKKPNVIVVGFFNGVGYDGGNNSWIDPNSEYFDEEWNDITFSAEYLKTYTANGKIGGFYLYTTARAYPATLGHTIYIDEISVVARNENSEQTGATVASFASENALANVAQNGKFNASTFSWVEEIFGAEGALAIEPAKSNSGAKYFFDRAFKPTENDALLLNIATKSTAAKTLKIYAMNGTTETLVGSFELASHAGAFRKIALKGKDLLSVGVTELCGLRFDIVATSVGAQATVYLDEITLYDVAADTDLPEIVQAASVGYSGLDGKLSVDLSNLSIAVADESDPTASWYIVSLQAPDGSDVTESIVENQFIPTVSGEYKLSVKARDIAGNESVTATELTVAVNAYTDKEAYYKAVWQFNDLGGLDIVTGAELKADVLDDGNGAISGLIKYDDFAPIGRQDLIIDMGGLYKVKEIQSITVRYRYLNDAKIGDSYVNMHLNVNGDKDVNNRLTGLTYAGANGSWYLAKASADFETITIPQASLKANILNGTLLTDEDYLTSLNFAQPAWRNASTAMDCRVTMQIDSIEVKLIPQFKAEYLEFNADGAADMLEGIGVQLVDLGGGNKAAQVTFKNDSLNDPDTAADDGMSGKINARINMGGVYKVSEIESVVISYKIITGDAKLWWRLNLNDIYDDNRRVMGKDYVTYSSATTSQGTPTANFETITIKNEGLKLNSSGNAILTDGDYLTAISFSNASWQQDLKYRCTIQIDYVRVNLKTQAAQA